MGKLLALIPQSLRLRIEADKQLVGADVQPLINLASRLVRGYPDFSNETLSGYRLQIDQIVAQGGEVPLSRQFTQEDRVWMQADFDRSTDAVRKVFVIESRPFIDADQSTRFVRLLKDAAAQLPRGVPSVVHIQVTLPPKNVSQG